MVGSWVLGLESPSYVWVFFRFHERLKTTSSSQALPQPCCGFPFVASREASCLRSSTAATGKGRYTPHPHPLSTCQGRGVPVRFSTAKTHARLASYSYSVRPGGRYSYSYSKTVPEPTAAANRRVRARAHAQRPYIRFRALMLKYSLITRSVKSFGDVSISITPDSRRMAA